MKPALAASLLALLLLHVLAALASFVAPYDPARQHREYPWTSPTPLSVAGFRLMVRGPASTDSQATYPVRFLYRDTDGLHLFGVDEPGKMFPLGTDGLGRDQFSRLLHGARVSLFSGLIAALFSAVAGACLGAVAGFYGGRTDGLIMRLAELFLALPWMYLLLAARAFFPLDADPRAVFLTLLALLGLIGWARPARLVRGIVLTAKEREFVLAARGFGASDAYLIWHHILPEAIPALATYLSLVIPQYVLAEATLSFLGLGFSGATPSWGSLLAALTQLEVLDNYWWMMLPAVAFAGVFACYNGIASSLKGAPPAP